MNNQVTRVSSSSVPHIVVTEPSPISNTTQNTVSVARIIESIPEVANGAGETPGSVKVSLGQATTKVVVSSETEDGTSKPCKSGEFTPAQECNDCVVPVSEQSASQSVEDSGTTATTEPEQDNFRRVDMGCCSTYGIQCIEYYEKLWNIIHSGYAIPFWLLLLALPVSAGYMSALYMYDCPASHSMSMLMFTIGISLMAVLSLRVCLIIRRMTATDVDNFRNMLHTLLLVSSFLTIVFFITESVVYWKMTSTSVIGTPDYCDPHFLNFSFWWNCVMCVVIVPIFFFPA